MVLPRSTFFRTLFTAQQSTRIAGSRASSRVWQQATRRYASGGGESKKSSDLPWIIGSVGITVPATYYLLADTPKESAHAEIHVPTHKDPEEPHVSEKQATKEAEEEEEKGMTEPERGASPSQRGSNQSVRGSEEEPEEPSEKSTASESVKDAERGESASSAPAEKIESAEKKEVR
ncbi:hypothetical protein ACJ73_02007 [Blastomyces percursus]|uniref:Uncharacterized protein n=1 Tax=Blastomyces percursus TaxID=1658174 RepID=A0A1J9RG46_9EURO|nr:hypothetical protein ACJ73_02007 [Blastomyces percursus]